MVWSRGVGLRSLRAKMSLAALGGLVTTAVLTGLLLLTANTAGEVVGAARSTQERLRIYSHLLTAANKYQEIAYRNVRMPGGLSRPAVVDARTRVENLLADVRRLPSLNPREGETHQRIQEQGRAVLDHYARADLLVERVNERWRIEGQSAAMAEMDRISQPIFTFQDTLQSEIRRVDWQLASATANAQSLLKTASVAALFGLLVALVFSAAVLLLLQLRLRPGLSRLESGARAFGSGNLDHRIGLTGTDELARLSRGFDTMAKMIAQKQAQLRETQLGLEHAVIARTRELRKANEELSTVNQRRQAFLADISHELRTPLTIIRGETQVAMRLAEQPGFDPHEVFERILKQTRDLSRMVDDLFVIARARAGVLPLHLERLDLQRLARDLASDFETVASERGGSIRILEGPAVMADVDADRLRRALAALVENALTHCQKGVNIALRVHDGPDFATIAVQDDGPGMDFDHAHALFDRFRRGETRGEGAGLGLSLVRALAKAHGGHAVLEPNEGRGTRAIMRFPVPIRQERAA